MTRVLALLVHELAHEVSSNHLSDDYFDALATLAGKLAVLALDEPQIFAFARLPVGAV